MKQTATKQNGQQTDVEPRAYKVDLWATDLNDVEIGILKQTQHRAASRQFTKDMEVIGQILEEGERTGIIAYRKGLWKDGTGAQRRLVIKLFSATMNWRATLDMMVGRSIQLSHGANGLPVPAFSINIAKHDQIVQLERSAYKWPLLPEKFSFFILEEDGPKFYKLRHDWASFGADFGLYDQNNQRIGTLDHKVINLGGAWKVKIDGDRANANLDAVLQLFCAMLRFNGECRRHVKRLAGDMHRGQLAPALDHHETDLYHNPRAHR